MDPNELRKQAADLILQARTFQAELDADDCDLNDDQRSKREQKIDELTEQATDLKKQAADIEKREQAAADRRRRLRELTEEGEKPRRQTAPGDINQAGIEVDEPGWKKDPNRGFASPREFFNKVTQAANKPSIVQDDDRLKYLSAVGSDEHTAGSDPYGGFFVPEGMSPDLLTTSAEANPLLERVQRIPMDATSIKINARVDKDHSTSVSGGLTVSRRSEAGGFTSSRMQTEQIELTANTLAGLSYATEELLQDSPRSVAALLEAGFREEFATRNVLDLLSGSGTGEPQGVLNAAATIAQAKEGSQTADTIVANNILKMRQRQWRYGNSIWLTNHDTYLQLIDLQVESDNNAGAYWLFRPGNGVDVPDTLLGRPVFFSEYAETLGDKGDIYNLNMSQYLYGIYQPLETAESIHVRFLNHERAFKFTMRDAGAPWWKSTLTPKKGANTLSPFVTLAARA